MLLTRNHIRIIHDTFSVVIPVSDQLTKHFYQRLFENSEEVRCMFAHADMFDQMIKFMKMLGTIVSNLDRLEKFLPIAEKLGARHVTYGVRGEHYEIFGEALLWALAQQLGEEFTDEAREAWETAYDILADAAISGAQQELERIESNRNSGN